MGSYEMRKQHLERCQALVEGFDWDLCGRRYMYVLEAARRYGERHLDFTAVDPEPPVRAIP
jgi:hypothetical protein